jgi:hypothetical protein
MALGNMAKTLIILRVATDVSRASTAIRPAGAIMANNDEIAIF